MSMKNWFIAVAICAATVGVANAAPERTLPLGDVSMEYIKIEGRIQTWELQKVCIDGQAYLLISGIGGPKGISPSFKDGKPEQCVVKSQK